LPAAFEPLARGLQLKLQEALTIMTFTLIAFAFVAVTIVAVLCDPPRK
jgi:hypothetical protein